MLKYFKLQIWIFKCVTFTFQFEFGESGFYTKINCGCIEDKLSVTNLNLSYAIGSKIDNDYMMTDDCYVLLLIIYRVFGRLTLILFLEGRRRPSGLDAQQRAEIKAEKVFRQASSATGMLVGFSRSLEVKLKTRGPELCRALAQSCPDMDDRCRKNYAVLIGLAKKV